MLAEEPNVSLHGIMEIEILCTRTLCRTQANGMIVYRELASAIDCCGILSATEGGGSPFATTPPLLCSDYTGMDMDIFYS